MIFKDLYIFFSEYVARATDLLQDYLQFATVLRTLKQGMQTEPFYVSIFNKCIKKYNVSTSNKSLNHLTKLNLQLVFVNAGCLTVICISKQ